MLSGYLPAMLAFIICIAVISVAYACPFTTVSRTHVATSGSDVLVSYARVVLGRLLERCFSSVLFLSYATAVLRRLSGAFPVF